MTDHSSNVFYRVHGRLLPVVDHAEGCWLVDTNGKRYLDASGGPVVVNLGYGVDSLIEAVCGQMKKCYYAHPTMFTNAPVEDLARKLASHAPSGISRFYFLTTGSEAIEASIKLARQIHIAYGRPEKFRLISRWKSYHGLSLGALSVTGRTGFRKPFAPMLMSVDHIAPPYCLRCFYGLTYPECNLQCARALEEVILNVGPETVSAFIAETVSGATIAAVPPPPGYWPLVRSICDRYHVLLILDEVMVGMGRTGRWFACEHYDLIPDIIALGKGISGGSLPLSAVGLQEKHYQQLDGGFTHGGTFSHHPVTASAGLATIRVLEDQDLVCRANKMGAILGNLLNSALKDSPFVAEVRGIGLLWGVELVQDKESLRPFPRALKVAERLWDHLFEQGIILYKSTSLAGNDGDALVIAPPFTIQESDMEVIVETLAKGINEVLGKPG